MINPMVDTFNEPVICNLQHTHIKNYKFFSSDSEEHFKSSLEKLGSIWKYACQEINYNYNNHGQRCPNINTITNNNFFVAYGCSHTEGIGLPESDRYSNILADRLKMQYLNFGTGGSSHNFLWINNILGCKNFKFKPKFVVCQWPEITRLASLSNRVNHNFNLETPNTIHNTDFGKLWEKYIMVPSFYQTQTLGYFHSINQMWNSIGVQVVHFTLDQETAELLKIKYFKLFIENVYERARDLCHPGFIQNLEFANFIEDELKNVGM